jgi:putative Mn2+ efflux pump MntP
MISWTEIILLSAGLCFDTFAVSLSSGICMPAVSRWNFTGIVLVFAVIQGGFTLAGWLAGVTVLKLVESVDHWIAFTILCYIGAKMILEFFRKKEKDPCIDLRKISVLLTVAVATSIDALAVGISMAMISLPKFRLIFSVAVIALFTAVSSAVGIRWGRKIGPGFGRNAELAGGVILIVIGVKILVEHLEYLS